MEWSQGVIQLFSHGDQVLIAYNVIYPDARRGLGNARPAFELCWTGAAWSSNVQQALTFNSALQAIAYRDANYDRLERSLGERHK